MLGVGQVVEEEEHPYDVQPPATTLYPHQRARREAREHTGEMAGDPEG